LRDRLDSVTEQLARARAEVAGAIAERDAARAAVEVARRTADQRVADLRVTYDERLAELRAPHAITANPTPAG
jgi:hypothetical protein